MTTNKESAMTNCGLCGGTHETFVKTAPDGSSHVYVDPITQARRVAAAKALNERARKLYEATHKS